MELIGVRIELPTNSPILILKEQNGSRFLPIWIGTAEAASIALAMKGIEPQRPLTHDLLRMVMEGLGSDVGRVVVTDLVDGTYFADLVLLSNGNEVVVSSRPSDAIALATRTNAPIFAAKSVVDEVGVEIRDTSQEEEIERFREFLDDIEPGDFHGRPQS